VIIAGKPKRSGGIRHVNMWKFPFSGKLRRM
jgi:hypothetical protein